MSWSKICAVAVGSLEFDSFVRKAERGTRRLPRNVARRAQNAPDRAEERLRLRIIAGAGDRDTTGGDVVRTGGAVHIED